MQLNEFSLLTVTTEKVTVFFLNHRSPFFTCAVKDEGLWTTETCRLLTAPTVSTQTASLQEGTSCALRYLRSYACCIY